MLTLSIVMPVFNERRTIREVIKRVKAVPRTKEIIIVDDCSTDGTRALLREYQNDPEVRVLFKEKNEGKGAALRTGFSLARNDIVIVQDADLEYDPNDYQILLRPFEAGRADVVYGSRFQHGIRRVLYYWHSVGNRALTALSNMLTDLNLTDMETCYKAFKRPIIQNIELESDRFGFEPEITAKVAKTGCVVYEVPVNYYGRSYAQGKKITWKDGVAALWHILKFSLSRRNCIKNLDAFRAAMTEPPPQDDVGLNTLEAFESATRYNDWICDRFRPHVGKRVLEIGSGIGNIAIATLAEKSVERFVATDLQQESLDILSMRLADEPRLTTVAWDISKPIPNALMGETFDTVICSNVLEHIEDHELALQRMQSLLTPGGKLLLLVPADQSIFSGLDEDLGHFRRYETRDLHALIEKSGFRVQQMIDHNFLGKIGWWWSGRVKGQRKLQAKQTKLFDSLVPLLRPIDGFFVRLLGGVSLIAVCEALPTAARVMPRAANE